MTRATVLIGRLLVSVALLIFMAIAVGAWLTQSTTLTTFDVGGRSEVVSISIDRATSVYVRNASVCYGLLDPGSRAKGGTCDLQAGQITEFSGSIVLLPRSRVRLVRVASGPLRVAVTNENSKATAILHADSKTGPSEEQVLTGDVNLQVGRPDDATLDGRSFVLQFVGHNVEVGGAASTSGTSYPLLLEASVTILGKQIVGQLSGVGARDRVYRVSQVTLGYGDMIRFDCDGCPSPHVSAGVVAIDGGLGMRFGVRTTAESVIVSRFFSDGYRLSATFFDRMLNDPLALFLWSVLSLVLGSGLLAALLVGLRF